MGHDIYAYKKGPTDDEDADREKVVYMWRGAFSPINKTIYTALNASKHYCGVSGCGSEQLFTMDEIQEALEDIPSEDEFEPEREFLNDCINSGLEEVWIGFY